MTSYVTQIVEAGQKLQGTGFNINDEWIGSIMLAGLSEKYMPMIMAIEHSGMIITTDAIKGKLMDMEPEDSDVNNAFASFKNKSIHYSKKVKSMRSMVGKDGGYQSTQMSSSVKDKPNVKCYGCKQYGYIHNQCTNTNIQKSWKITQDSESKTKTINAFSAVFFNGTFDKGDWYVDSGASSHLTCNMGWLKDVCYSGFTKEIMIANRSTVSVECCGTVNVTTSTAENDYNITVEKVLCVPHLATNLLSVGGLVKQGNKVRFTGKGCEIFNKKNTLVATASLINGVYKLNTSTSLVAAAIESAIV